VPYSKPLQKRAVETQTRFLKALDELLRDHALEELSVAEIAEHAGLTKAAFMKRFGRKEQALFVLFEIYADQASLLMHHFVNTFDDYDQVEELFYEMSRQFEVLLTEHFSANRAMNEYAKRQLESHDLTKKIFVECIAMMKALQSHFLADGFTDQGAASTAQLLVTIDFHYVMRAMPALPSDSQDRHRLISQILNLAVRT